MTRPIGGKPESTQDRYNDVHSVGSSFGAELDEDAVRSLLGNQVENPFFSIVTGLANTVVDILESVAKGITGLFNPGAKETPIRNAIIAVMEPLESDVYNLGLRLTALSDEAMARIDTQQGLIDTANVAIGEAKDLAAAVQAIADQNKKDVASAIAKADTVSASLSELTPKITAALETANKAASDLADLTPKVTAAQEKADSAYTEAENVRNEVTPKIEEAQTKGESALAVADTAVDWLKNPTEIGTSVIAINPETKHPHYANTLEIVDDNPPGSSGPTYMSPASMASVTSYGPIVPVDPKIKYTVSFWAKASVSGSRLNGQLRSQEGRTVAPDGSLLMSGTVSVSNPPQPSNRGEDGKYVHSSVRSSSFIRNIELQTEWTYYESEIQFAEGVTGVNISTMRWNHSGGVPADQYISGLDIRPQIPTQASVDQAQNDAIRANTEILRQQDEINEAQRVANLAQQNFNDNQTKWNEAVDRSIETQGAVNDNFEKWTEGATTAIQANTSAIKALGKIETGESLIAYLTPTDAEVRAGTAKYDVPVWTTGAHRAFSGQNQPPEQAKYAFGASSTDGVKTAKAVPATVRPGTKYILSFWAYGSGNLVICMRGNGNGNPILSTRQLKVDQETLRIEKDAGGRRMYDPAGNGNSSSSIGSLRLLSGFKPDQLYEWTHYKYEVEFTETTTEVWFNQFYWNWNETSVYGQFLAGMQFYPDVPTQADVDEAQNKAIEANTEFAKQQVEINNLFQEQMWSQLDMIEQLELQSPRVYFQNVDDGSLTSNIPSWVGWSSAREYKNTFINFYHRHTDTKRIYWQATGKWEGQVRLTMNWDNGAVDTYVYTVEKDRIRRGSKQWQGRTMINEGGAAFVYHRNTTFEVYPKHLGRWFNLFWNPENSRWYHSTTDLDIRGVEGAPGILRWDTANSTVNPGIRLSTSFRCNQPLTLTDLTGKETTYSPGQTINPQVIDVSKMDKSKVYEFHEVGIHW